MQCRRVNVFVCIHIAFYLACAKWKERHFRMISEPQPHIRKKCFRANASRFVEQRILFFEEEKKNNITDLYTHTYIEYIYTFSYITSKNLQKREKRKRNNNKSLRKK